MKVKHCNLIIPLKCEVDSPLVDAAKVLKENKQRRLIVVKDDVPIGIISTTDMSNRVVAEGKSPTDLKAEDVMTQPIFLECDVEDNVAEIYQKMLKHKSFFVPVKKEGKLYAILTYGEIIKQVEELLQNES